MVGKSSWNQRISKSTLEESKMTRLALAIFFSVMAEIVLKVSKCTQLTLVTFYYKNLLSSRFKPGPKSI